MFHGEGGVLKKTYNGVALLEFNPLFFYIFKPFWTRKEALLYNCSKLGKKLHPFATKGMELFRTSNFL